MLNVSKRKILVVTGTRAEYGLLKPVLVKIKESRRLSLLLVATGMHVLKRFGYTVNVIKKDGFNLDGIIKIDEKDSQLGTLSKEIMGLEKFCIKNKPDFILILGDRDEPLAAAITGSHLGIPVGHIHGGDVSGSGNIDELIRHAITKFSHIHFTATTKSYKRVIKLGEEPFRVFLVGAPGLDELNEIKYLKRHALAKRLGINDKKNWALIIQHPVPFDKIQIDKQISETLKAVEKLNEFEKIIIYPNNDPGSEMIIKEIRNLEGKPNYHVFRNLDRYTYINILKNAKIMIGNSSSGIIESGFFRLPVVDIGIRQKGREHGINVLHADHNASDILKKIKMATSGEFRIKIRNMTHPYGDGTASTKITKILEKIVSNPNLLLKRLTYADI